MSDNNNFDLDIDSILAEFSSYSDSLVKPEKEAESAGPVPAAQPDIIEAQPAPRTSRPEAEERSHVRPAQPSPRRAERAEASAVPRRAEHAPARAAGHAAQGEKAAPARHTESRPERASHQAVPRKSAPEAFNAEMLGYKSAKKANKAPKREERAQPAEKKQERAPVSPAWNAVRNIIGAVFALVSVLTLCWIFVNIHPDSGTVTTAAAETRLDLAGKLDTFSNNAASDALSELTYIPKIYTIPESDTVAPKPDPAKYGSTTDPADIQALIDSAAALLNGQKVAFDPNADFVAGSDIKYYFDDTILVITWKEVIEGKCVTCSEVKIAHGSQLKRKIAGDTYSTGIRFYATDMAKQCNAVVAINGDFYDFRQIGVTAYQRKLYRFAPDKLDSCHFTSSGDMLFSYAGELTDEAYTQQFIDDNDVLFTVSFGPVLVDNGELRPVSGYPIGEINQTYSRSAIGQLDELHYFLMTVNYADGFSVAATVNQIGEFIYSKGCQKAYALDGGQTSIIVMDGKAVNHVDYGNERTMSDLIYFATAIPEEEAAQ